MGKYGKKNCAEIAALRAEFNSFKELCVERDGRYHERANAARDAVHAAQVAAEKAGDKTEMALKEYKIGANEWRDTVKDLIAAQGGEKVGSREAHGRVAVIVSLAIALCGAIVAIIGLALR